VGDTYEVTVRPANSPELELELDIDDFDGDFDQLATFAREQWLSVEHEDGLAALQLHVAIEQPGDRTSGRYGSAQESEEAMLARMQREAEEEAGLV